MADLDRCAAEVARLLAARERGDFVAGYDPLKHGNIAKICRETIRKVAPVDERRVLVRYNPKYATSPLGRAIEAAGNVKELKYLPAPIYSEVQQLLRHTSGKIDRKLPDEVEWAIVGVGAIAATAAVVAEPDLMPTRFTVGLGEIDGLKVRAVVGVSAKGGSHLEGITFREIGMKAEYRW